MITIYFIAGASGSGKSTILKPLQDTLDDSIAVYDFDDIGVPADADTQWRQATTEQWISKLAAKGKNACLLGKWF